MSQTVDNSQRIKLLYITCPAHGGSTLTGRLFGHYEGFFNAGQIHGGIFVPRLFHGRTCGCSELIENCKIWSKVIQVAFGDPENTPVQKIVEWNKKVNDLTILNGMMSGRLQNKSPWNEYIPILDKFYRTIQEVTKCRVIVDSSRIPGYAYLLTQLPSVEVYIAHVVRDPRGVIYSAVRRAKKVDGNQRPDLAYAWIAPKYSLSVIKHYLVTSWMWRNNPTRFTRFRYKDMIANGESELMKVFDMLGEPLAGSPFVAPHMVDLSGDHTSGGNRMRMKTGMLELKEDLAWQTNLNTRDRFIVTALTWPIMAQQGLFSSPAQQRA